MAAPDAYILVVIVPLPGPNVSVVAQKAGDVMADSSDSAVFTELPLSAPALPRAASGLEEDLIVRKMSQDKAGYRGQKVKKRGNNTALNGVLATRVHTCILPLAAQDGGTFLRFQARSFHATQPAIGVPATGRTSPLMKYHDFYNFRVRYGFAKLSRLQASSTVG